MPFLPTIGNNDLPAYYDIWGADYAARYNESWFTALERIYVPAILRSGRAELAPDFANSFAAGGYYSVEITGEDLMVISLNTNIFATNVADKHSQSTLAEEQLAWLTATLKNTITPRVVIIGHHPPGMSLYSLYRSEAAKANWRLGHFEKFRTICSTAEGRIVGMFFGHEHQESFAVERDAGSGEEMGMFSIPSVSPVYQGQPSYCIAQLDEDKKLVDLMTYHTWLDYYTRTHDEPQFFTYKSLGGILGVEELSFEGILTAAANIIDESDGMKTCSALKNKIYQGRFVPTLPPHLHYCYSTSMHTSSFIQCIEKYGYDGKKYIVNS